MFYRKHPRVTHDCGPIQITKQSHKAECDINNILKQYQKTGIINHINLNKPLYTDLPSDIDYQSSLNLLMEADNTFSTLPSVVRDYFNNNPAAFLAAFSDPSQADKLREWGLLNPLPSPLPNNLKSPSADPALASSEPATGSTKA